MGDHKTNSEGCISHGPWGGSTGTAWVWMPKSIIKKITIMHGEAIDYIKFQSDYCAGETEGPRFGYPGSFKQTTEICIDNPNEYFVSISGTYGEFNIGEVVVKSLCFVTNQKRYGPYGSDSGTRFSYDGKGGVIVGFHGRENGYLNAIGIYVMPEPLAFSRNSTSEQNSLHEICSSCMSKMVTPKEAGPWGASSGEQWDDGVFSTVKHIHVFMEGSLKVFRAIQFVYVKRDSKFSLSSMHGGTCGDNMELASLVSLDGKDEYLTRISGFYGPADEFNGVEAITSITFHTNKTIHGPYGERSGDGYTYFSSTQSPGKVVGFHGRKSNGLLTAIGVHMEYF